MSDHDTPINSFKKLDKTNKDAEFFAQKAQKFSEKNLEELITEQDLADFIQSAAKESDKGSDILGIDSVVNMIKAFVSQNTEENLRELYSPASMLLYIANLARKIVGNPLLTPEECSKEYKPAFEFQKNENFLYAVRDEMSPVWQEITDKSVDAGINFININKNDEAFQGENKIELLKDGAKNASFTVINNYLLDAIASARHSTGYYEFEVNINDEIFLVGALKDSVGSGISLGVEQAFAA